MTEISQNISSQIIYRTSMTKTEGTITETNNTQKKQTKTSNKSRYID